MSVDRQGLAIANSQDAIREAVQAHKAMAILRLLDGDLLRGSANDQLLGTALGLLGLRTSRAEVGELLDLLEREGAIHSSRTKELLVVQLKHHGQELARGLVIGEGIESPQLDN